MLYRMMTMPRSSRTLVVPFLLVLLLLPGSLAIAGEPNALTEDDKGDASSGDDQGDDQGDDELPPWAEPKEDEGDDTPTEGEDGDAAGEAAPAEATVDTAEAAPAEAEAASGSWKGGGLVGLGFLVGTDNGLSLKLWPNRTHGVHIHLSAPLRLNALSVGVAYQFHLAGLSIPGSPVHLHPYVGPAFRLRVFIYENNTAYVDGHGGAAIGMSVTVADVPAEIFFEVVPGLTFGINIPGVGIGFDVGGHVGARFYFGS